MAVGWHRRETLPSNRYQDRAARASVGQCQALLTFSAYSRLWTVFPVMLTLTMSGAESRPSATLARAMTRAGEVTILMSVS